MLKPRDRIGDWIVEHPLGQGGMGTVYRCTNVLSERMVAAVKVVGSESRADARERFVREVEALVALDHEAVVGVQGGGEDSEHSVLYLVMELVEGEPLQDRLVRGPLPWPEAAAVFRALADGLAHAHERGIRHRDIKPGNIMLTPEGGAKLLDFGIAVHRDRTRLTRDRSVPGTLVYIAPEGFRGEEMNPTLADVYGLGLTLYEAVVGTTPFSVPSSLSEGERLAAIMREKLGREGLDPGSEVPLALRELIQLSTSPDPSRRPPSMRAFAAYLDATLAGEPPPDARTLARRFPPPTPVPASRDATTSSHGLHGHHESTFALPDELHEGTTVAIDAPDEDAPPQRRLALVAIAGLAAGVLGMGALGALLWTMLPAGESTRDTGAAEVPPLEAHDVAMVRISRGGFFMGSPEDEEGRGAEESRHPVDLTRDFELADVEVSQGLWHDVLGTNPVRTEWTRRDGETGGACSTYGIGDDLPVFCVSWVDAVRFCNALSEQTGLEPAYTLVDGDVIWDPEADGYRLPTEAEWEYAARAGTSIRFAGADADRSACDIANVANPRTKERYRSWLSWPVFDCDDGFAGPAAVASLRANAWGLHDMTGNVWEWTWDPYGPYPASAVTDPTGEEGDADRRVIRGGGWETQPRMARVANRGAADATDRRISIGLRVARTP